jgi:hypothetical protein
MSWQIAKHHTPGDSFFPTLNGGFWADATAGTEKLRLFAHVEGKRWVASVFNVRTKEWLSKSEPAKNATEAKAKGEATLRRLFPTSEDLSWQSVGGQMKRPG